MKLYPALLLLLMLLMSCSSNLSFNNASTVAFQHDDEIKHLVTRYKNKGRLNQIEKNIMEKMAYNFLGVIKANLGNSEWQSFYQTAMNEDVTLEHSLIKAYGKLIYDIGGEMFYGTDMPYQRKSTYNVAQAGFANIMFLNETSLKDQAEIAYIFEYSSAAIEKIFLPSVKNKADFHQKLAIMNDGYINVVLISGQAEKEATGLNYVTAYSRSSYRLMSTDFLYTTYIEAKYVNILYSVSFLHELVHSVLALSRIPVEEMKLSRNSYPEIAEKIRTTPFKNIMLEEGLAEYVTRNASVWSKMPIFEPVNSELMHMVNTGLPLLTLAEMQQYYYGEEKRSFRYVQHGLLSAHALVDYLIQRFDIATVVTLIELEDIAVNAEEILGSSWQQVLQDWHNSVLNN